MKKTVILSVLVLFFSSGFLYANAGTKLAKEEASSVTVGNNNQINKAIEDGSGPFDLIKKLKNKIQKKTNRFKKRFEKKNGDNFLQTLLNFLLAGLVAVLLGLILIVIGGSLLYTFGAILVIVGVVFLILHFL